MLKCVKVFGFGVGVVYLCQNKKSMNQYKNINTRENYDRLLSSGMFWEFHPELSGDWERDKKAVVDGKVRLTPRQNMVIFCLQNGWSLITQSHTHVVTCCSSKGQFEFNSSLLFRLVKMGLIHQSNWLKENFEYVLTALGQEVVTKKVDLDKWM